MDVQILLQSRNNMSKESFDAQQFGKQASGEYLLKQGLTQLFNV